MIGEDDLNAILSSLAVKRRAGVYVYVAASEPVPEAAATIHEDEGPTIVLEREVAERLGLRWSFAAAWLTVEVHTSLEAVGVTAALAAALAEARIPCNVLAGFHHDHLLVPLERAGDALATLESVRVRATHNA